MDGSVLSIFICSETGEPMTSIAAVSAIAGKGLQGDRYAGQRGAFSKSGRPVKRHVTLIAAEDVAAVNSGLTVPFTLGETRRNIVTLGIPLQKLVGRVFMVGGAWLRGVEPCEPCDRPAKLAGKIGFKAMFAGRAGIRAEVLTGGIIGCGWTVHVCPGRFNTSCACDENHAHGLDCGSSGDVCVDCGYTNADHARW